MKNGGCDHQRITCIFPVGCNNFEIRTSEVIINNKNATFGIGFVSCSNHNLKKIVQMLSLPRWTTSQSNRKILTHLNFNNLQYNLHENSKQASQCSILFQPENNLAKLITNR